MDTVGCIHLHHCKLKFTKTGAKRRQAKQQKRQASIIMNLHTAQIGASNAHPVLIDDINDDHQFALIVAEGHVGHPADLNNPTETLQPATTSCTARPKPWNQQKSHWK